MGYILYKNDTNLMYAPVGLKYQELLTDFEVSGKLHDIEKALHGGGYSIGKLIFIIYSVLITEEREYLFEDILTFVVEVKDNRDITIDNFFRCIDRITKLNGKCEASHYIHSATLYLCSILLMFERLSTRRYDLRIFGDKIKTIDWVMSRKVDPKEKSITEIELHIYSRGIENENYSIKRYVLPLEIEKKLYEQLKEWHNRIGSVRIDQLSPTCQKLISKRKIGENCKIILDNHATDSIALVLSKIDEIIDDGNTDIAIYKDQIRYVYLGVLLTQYDRDKDYEKLQKGKKRKQKKERDIKNSLWTTLGYILAVPLWAGVIAFALAMIYMLILLPAWTDGLFNMKAEYVWYNPITWGECWWENLCRLEWLNIAIIPLSLFYINIVCEEIKVKGKTKERIIISIILYTIIIWYFPVIMNILIAILAFIATALSGFGLLMEIVNENYY